MARTNRHPYAEDVRRTVAAGGTVESAAAGGAAARRAERRGCSRLEIPLFDRQTFGNILFGVIVLLLGVLVIAALIVSLVDPATFGHGSPQGIGDLVLPAIVVCVLAFFMCGAFYLVKMAILDRLVVTSDGLISRSAGFIKVRTTTMPWSSITSLTVMPALGAGRRAGYRNAVYAILDSGQIGALPGTERRLVAAAAIAEQLTAMLDEHRAGSRPITTDSVAEKASPSLDTSATRGGSGTYEDDSAV